MLERLDTIYGWLQVRDELRIFIFSKSISNLDYRPDDCTIREYQAFSDCKNILLILSDMKFHPVKREYFAYSSELYHQKYSEVSLSRDIKRVFGQAKVRENKSFIINEALCIKLLCILFSESLKRTNKKENSESKL